MYNNLIEINSSNGEYSTVSMTWSEDYKKIFKSKVKEYYMQDNTEKINVLNDEIAKLDKHIQQVLLLKAEKELELDFINKAEAVKEKNKEIENYINELRQRNEINRWIKDNDSWRPGEYIQNGTYRFSISVYTSENYRTNKVEYYEVCYWFSINKILDKYSKTIKSVTKKFSGKEKDKMLGYIEGRKNAYAKYFTEEKPPIIKDYAHCIEMNGIVLDGYRVEEGE